MYTSPTQRGIRYYENIGLSLLQESPELKASSTYGTIIEETCVPCSTLHDIENLIWIENDGSLWSTISDCSSKLPEERHGSSTMPMQHPKVPQNLDHHFFREASVVAHLGPHHHHQDGVPQMPVRLIMRFPVCDIVGTNGRAPHCSQAWAELYSVPALFLSPSLSKRHAGFKPPLRSADRFADSHSFVARSRNKPTM